MAKLEDCYKAGWEISFNTIFKQWIGRKDDHRLMGDTQSDVFTQIIKIEKWPAPEDHAAKALEEELAKSLQKTKTISQSVVQENLPET